LDYLQRDCIRFLYLLQFSKTLPNWAAHVGGAVIYHDRYGLSTPFWSFNLQWPVC